MRDNVVEKVRDAFEDILKDKKTLVKVLSVAAILLLALILRMHDQSKSDISIETDAPADTSQQQEESDETSETEDEDIIYVDISGAVNEPGVYKVSGETRLYEVIEMAGGLSENADTDSVNRASFVEDGQKIIIPEKGSGNSGSASSLNGVIPSAPGGQQLVNINTASADELKTLNGIGDVIAERIIEYRSHSAFKSIEDIMSVDGIGKKTYEKIKDRITC